jgi:hypothetical protein
MAYKMDSAVERQTAKESNRQFREALITKRKVIEDTFKEIANKPEYRANVLTAEERAIIDNDKQTSPQMKSIIKRIYEADKKRIITYSSQIKDSL